MGAGPGVSQQEPGAVRPEKDTRRTPFHANWHCLQATKDSLYQFHPVACRERLRGDLPAWLWGSPNSQPLLLPRHRGGKTNPKREKKTTPNPNKSQDCFCICFQENRPHCFCLFLMFCPSGFVLRANRPGELPLSKAQRVWLD